MSWHRFWFLSPVWSASWVSWSRPQWTISCGSTETAPWPLTSATSLCWPGFWSRSALCWWWWWTKWLSSTRYGTKGWQRCPNDVGHRCWMTLKTSSSVHQGPGSVPEASEASVWDQTGDELSVLMPSLTGNPCRVKHGTVFKLMKGQGSNAALSL